MAKGKTQSRVEANRKRAKRVKAAKAKASARSERKAAKAEEKHEQLTAAVRDSRRISREFSGSTGLPVKFFLDMATTGDVAKDASDRNPMSRARTAGTRLLRLCVGGNAIVQAMHLGVRQLSMIATSGKSRANLVRHAELDTIVGMLARKARLDLSGDKNEARKAFGACLKSVETARRVVFQAARDQFVPRLERREFDICWVWGLAALSSLVRDRRQEFLASIREMTARYCCESGDPKPDPQLVVSIADEMLVSVFSADWDRPLSVRPDANPPTRGGRAPARSASG